MTAVDESLAQEVETVMTNTLIEDFDVPPDAIRHEAGLEAFDLDSLDFVDIGQVIQQHFGVRLKAEDFVFDDPDLAPKNYGDMLSLIINKVADARVQA